MPDHEDAPPSQQPQVIHVGSNLPLPSALQLKGNSSVNWKRFRQAWDNYEIAARLKSQDKEFRTARDLLASGKTLWIFMMAWPSMKKLTRKILTSFFKS